MFRTVSSFPCALCSRRLADTIKTHHDAFINYNQAHAIKNHIYNSSETCHQLDKYVLRKILPSKESRTYWSTTPKETSTEIDNLREFIRLKNTNNLHK